jgi:hypothetical protein
VTSLVVNIALAKFLFYEYLSLEMWGKQQALLKRRHENDLAFPLYQSVSDI